MTKNFLTYEQQILKLRTLFLKYILHIERHLKSLISYYFCEKFGENQGEYLNSKNFPGYSEKQLHQFITIIAKCRNVYAQWRGV